MGRAGSGSSGGGSHSSGGGYRSHSSGGHRVGQSSSSRRAGQGMSFGGSLGSSRPSYSSPRPPRPARPACPPPPPPPPHHHPPHYPPRADYGYRSTVHRPTNPVSAIVSVLVVIFIMVVMFIAIGNSLGTGTGNIPASTQNRDKLTGTAFSNSCVVDELGWVENQSSLSKKLQYFFNKTGVQPYIYLKAYDSSLTSDNQKTQFAEQYYKDNIDNEYTFLFVYFAEPNENDVGYMSYVNGYSVTSVMDAEAVDIFWSYIDKYWYSDLSTVDMFDKVFSSTADRVMTKSTTMADVGMGVVIIIGVVVAVIIVIVCICIKRKHDKARAEETAAILNAPIEDLADSDDLLDKYSK